MIIHAKTKKNRHIGYTAKNVRELGSWVPLKKFIDAVLSAVPGISVRIYPCPRHAGE
jgi:hypothetical protein